jgi:hypothetical protein
MLRSAECQRSLSTVLGWYDERTYPERKLSESGTLGLNFDKTIPGCASATRTVETTLVT